MQIKLLMQLGDHQTIPHAGLSTPYYARLRGRDTPRASLLHSALLNNTTFEDDHKAFVPALKSVINAELFASPAKDLRGVIFEEPTSFPGMPREPLDESESDWVNWTGSRWERKQGWV